VTADDSGYDTACSDDTPIRHILRSHGDTFTILHELLEEERQQRIELQVELANEKQARQNVKKNIKYFLYLIIYIYIIMLQAAWAFFLAVIIMATTAGCLNPCCQCNISLYPIKVYKCK
jgi:hypothetical protein